MSKNEVVIQFSGGIDSLYLAYSLSKTYDKVHLLTFNKGYLHFGFNFSKPNIDNLKKILGKDKITYNLIDMKPLFKEMAVKGFMKNLILVLQSFWQVLLLLHLTMLVIVM